MSKLIFWPQARPERKRKHHFISLTVWTLLTPHNVFYLLNSNWRRIKNDNDERTQSTSTLRGSTSQNYTLFLLKSSPQSGWVAETNMTRQRCNPSSNRTMWGLLLRRDNYNYWPRPPHWPHRPRQAAVTAGLAGASGEERDQ